MEREKPGPGICRSSTVCATLILLCDLWSPAFSGPSEKCNDLKSLLHIGILLSGE